MTRSVAQPTSEQRSPARRRLNWKRLRSVLQLLQVRLRLPIVLITAALVIGQWDLIRNYWGRLTRVVSQESIALQAVSSDTEYFCPMDPGVISNWPSKCGVCNMSLVRRKRGEAMSLPDGVVARMQLSPNRIQLAGIETAAAAFRPLAIEYESAGLVTLEKKAPVVVVEIPLRQAAWIAAGQAVLLNFLDLPGREGLKGQVRDVSREVAGGWEHARATIAIKGAPGEVRAGMPVLVRFQSPIAALEPFRSLPENPPALEASEPRVIYVCPEHPDSIGLERGICPLEQNARVARTLEKHQRVRFWCPMHPEVTADHAGEKCRPCGGMTLLPRVVSFRPAGQVLAVRRSAVIDGGAKKVVFVESMPGMFDGLEVVLGPRCGEFYPVVRGLEAGQKVAVAGAFLLDAETRLNPSLASAYFGAGRGDHHAAAPQSVTTRLADLPDDPFAGLSHADQAIARRQKTCPVTDKPLGSMGTPARAVAHGKLVFLCCDGCKDKLNRDPEKYLAKLAVP